MKISELISRLDALLKERGDVDVFISHDWSDVIDSESVNYIPESLDHTFHEYWPPMVEIAPSNINTYDHRGEYVKRVKK